jgi:hypothetical protein
MRNSRFASTAGAALVAMMMLGACGKASVPDELIGAWGTTTAQYADRGFRLTPDSLYLITGPGGHEAYRVKAVARRDERDRRRYDVTYANDIRKFDLRLYYHPAEGVVRLASRNQMVWTRR